MTLPIGWQMYAMLPERVTKQKCVNSEVELQELKGRKEGQKKEN
jgi:hypothetical protein